MSHTTLRPESRMSFTPEEKRESFPAILWHLAAKCSLKPRRIRGESCWKGAIMPGQLQETFGCVVTNRFDQLFDDEEDPFEVLKQAEKKKDATAPGAAKTAAQAAKQAKKESQKERRNLAPEKKEEIQAPVPLKKDGKHRLLWARHFLTLFLSEQSAKGANVTTLSPWGHAHHYCWWTAWHPKNFQRF